MCESSSRVIKSEFSVLISPLFDRYNFLVERSRDKLSVLQLVNQEVASFEEMHEELLTWLQAKESAINQLGLIGVQQEQLSELKLQLKVCYRTCF